VAWAEDNGVLPIKQTAFGRDMKKRITRDDSGQRRMYMNCRLHNVPLRTMPARNPDDRWERMP
jgi:hypothetical protein